MAKTTKLSITPLHDRVIVRAAAAETKTAGGIIIPDTAKENLNAELSWPSVLVKKTNQ